MSDQGWRVVDRDRDTEWWADEIWTVESEWSPQGFTVFVTWLTDPMNESRVWACAASAERPTHHSNADTLGYDILASIAAARDEALRAAD